LLRLLFGMFSDPHTC